MLSGSAHAVVLQHGYTSSKDGFHLARIAKGLARGGVGSLRSGPPPLCICTPDHASSHSSTATRAMLPGHVWCWPNRAAQLRQ